MNLLKKGYLLISAVLLMSGFLAVVIVSFVSRETKQHLKSNTSAGIVATNTSSISASSADTDESGAVINMTKNGFSPREITINKGESVIFLNNDTKNRWPASNIHPSHRIYPEFDPKTPVEVGKKWGFAFNRPGSWRFHDHLFPEYTGFINVSGASSESVISLLNNKKISMPSPNEKAERELDTINIFLIARGENEVREWLKKVGPKKIMEKLLKDAGGGSIYDCHQESHIIGRISYEIYGAPVFGQGSASCHSGFYHGAMEEFLSENGTANLAKKINEICDNFNTSFGRFECLHGVGHGVMAYEDYDLIAANDLCGTLGDSFVKSSCLGGVFMENIVIGQGLGTSKGHTTKWLNNDPLFPCNKIDQDYDVQYQCYQMQTSWMLTLYKYDFTKVSSSCMKARSDMISVCFKSYGRDAAGHTLRNREKIRDLCARTPGEYFSQCIIGAVNVIIDFWGDKVEANASDLCRVLPESGKLPCYSAISSRLVELFASKEQRKAQCDTFEKEYRILCNNG